VLARRIIATFALLNSLMVHSRRSADVAKMDGIVMMVAVLRRVLATLWVPDLDLSDVNALNQRCVKTESLLEPRSHVFARSKEQQRFKKHHVLLVIVKPEEFAKCATSATQERF